MFGRGLPSVLSCFLSTRGRGSLGLRWWQAHLRCIAISGGFEAAATEHQRRIVSPAERYLDVDSVLSLVFLDCFSWVFFLFPRSPRSPWEEFLSSGSRTLRRRGRLRRSGLSSILCFLSFSSSAFCLPFFTRNETVDFWLWTAVSYLRLGSKRNRT